MSWTLFDYSKSISHLSFLLKNACFCSYKGHKWLNLRVKMIMTKFGTKIKSNCSIFSIERIRSRESLAWLMSRERLEITGRILIKHAMIKTNSYCKGFILLVLELLNKTHRSYRRIIVSLCVWVRYVNRFKICRNEGSRRTSTKQQLS